MNWGDVLSSIVRSDRHGGVLTVPPSLAGLAYRLFKGSGNVGRIVVDEKAGRPRYE